MKKNFHFKSLRLASAHHRTGFTLIEVLITVAIVTVLSVGAVITLMNFLSHQYLNSTAGEIAASLMSAQEKSISQDSGVRWGVYFDHTTDTQYYALFQANEALISSSTYLGIPGTEIERTTLHSNLAFSNPATGSSTTILFNKVSGVPSASTTISIRLSSDSASQKNVIISGNGKIDFQ